MCDASLSVCGLSCLQAGSSSFKKQRAAQRTADAGNRAAWSSLFMRADTVAEAVAAHYGVSKGQLLDAAAEDLPLRMALGEAQVCRAAGSTMRYIKAVQCGTAQQIVV